MKNFTLLLSILCIFHWASAQSIYQNFPIDSISITTIEPTQNGYLIKATDQTDNSLQLLETDPDGHLTNQQSFFPNSAPLPYQDGFFYETGSTGDEPNRDLTYTKRNASGDTLWHKTIQRPMDNYGRKILPTSDGGLLVAGATAVAGDTLHRIVLTKINEAGEVKWQRIVPKEFTRYDRVIGYILGLNTSDYVFLKEPQLKHFVETPDGYLLNNSEGLNSGGVLNYEEHLIKFDINGKALWQFEVTTASKNIGNPVPSANYNSYGLKSILGADDSTTRIQFNTKVGTSSYSATRLMKLDTNGHTDWIVWKGNGHDYRVEPFAAAFNPDGSTYWVADDASMQHFGVGFIRHLLTVYKTDADGANEVAATYNLSNDAYFSPNGDGPFYRTLLPSAILSDGNEGFVMAGSDGNAGQPFFLKENPANQCTKHVDGFEYYGEYSGHQYFLSNMQVEYTEASALAEAAGGYLLSINGLGESEYITSLSFGNEVLIGLNDEAVEGQPVWQDGQPVNFTHFDTAQTNSPEADWAFLNLNTGHWEYTDYPYGLFIMELDCGLPTVAKPDLLPVDFTEIYPAARPGLSTDLKLLFQNAGSSDMVGMADLKIYISADQLLSDDDALVGNFTIENTPMSFSKELDLTVDIPIDQPMGLHYFIVKMDNGNDVDELDEANNLLVASSTIDITPLGADLLLSSITPSPANALQGETIDLDFDIENIGSETVTTPFHVHFFLSPRPYYWNTFSPVEMKEAIYVGSETVAGVDAESITHLTTSITVPDSLPFDRYYTIAYVDGNLAIDEANESNNTYFDFLRTTITGDYGPDLTIQNVSTFPTIVPQGGPIEFHLRHRQYRTDHRC